ncbi:MAG: ABC transporter permease [Rubrimonas sp.]|uniref:ABC transporter permease n=1 Tax=Rubrimonas sp. TaxID=2036015 RepID=UPI002FDDC112
MGFYLGQFLTGLASASSLFLVASGLSIIFGVTRIVNFAHGSFYMLGAYLAYSLVNSAPLSGLSFWASVLGAATIVGLLGVAMEMLVLRRIYQAPELFQLVATFGVVLIVQDAALYIWGGEDLLGPRAPGLTGAVRIMGEPIPEYDLFLIVVGPAIMGLLWLLFHRTRWGVLVRAATEDREMVAALGVNQRLLFSSVFFLGAFLAGLGGALQVPREAVTLHMDLTIIADVFVVVVVGGLGSVAGAFLAAMLISELNAFALLILPQITLVLPFIVMGVVLILRPYGLMGRPETGDHPPMLNEEPLKLATGPRLALIWGAVAALALAPLVAGDFGLLLIKDVLIFALFAASLHFIMGIGGMASFGHAAWFGLSAYAAALGVKLLGLGMVPALVLGPLTAAAAAVIVGWFCVKRSGVYFAMLTLAAAQIVWSVAYQWYEVTGGDDGILGVWPADWASGRTNFYLMALVLCLGGVWALRRMAHASFGYVLRGGRDSALRAEAIGIDLKRHQWLAFVIAAALGGLAGAIYAFSKGSVFPDELAIPRSFDALLMVLLGGVQALMGPIIGATVFILLEDAIFRLDYWRFIFGLTILGIVILAPDGVAGGLRRLERWAFARRRG